MQAKLKEYAEIFDYNQKNVKYALKKFFKAKHYARYSLVPPVQKNTLSYIF